jgi:hypothetical protein
MTEFHFNYTFFITAFNCKYLKQYHITITTIIHNFCKAHIPQVAILASLNLLHKFQFCHHGCIYDF